MAGIDYSKWDKLCDSGTSSGTEYEGDRDDKGHDDSSRAPQVTRLEYPSRVTLGPNGVQLEQVPPKASASPFPGTCAPPEETDNGSVAVARCPIKEESFHAEYDTGASNASSHATGNTAGRRDDDQERMGATDDDEDLLYESLARNGGREGSHHWWTQTEDTVTVSFLVPWETKGKSVTEFRLYEARSTTALESELLQAHLEITILVRPACLTSPSSGPSASAAPLRIHQVFRYPVKLSEDLIDGCWQLHFMPRRHLRLLVVQLFKEPVGLGMTLWWDRCFVTDTTSVIADTQTIPDRKRRMEATPGSKEKAGQFRKVWADAHEEFRRRAQERKRKIIE
ncbi:conserved hypothetical protein [Leishmania major strain Friedlin]|uniref:CS domain-containing protein n=1 Tax=Leishmania major TaxID=5664 RepID=E9AF76_LEIMA|nr:conserved hypothetical protein [Leishmania major strain Friedlin]CAG9582605.1 hypothetical_protein_-_conserved [Leishmania major strain Friedlin]CBZ12880.1 conserved hypothetical protein [Leishmania major strain Friedlin]|eukprot:XP_003722646.1 conserved hypothetical protein [Leishmania major strain Friedlin]